MRRSSSSKLALALVFLAVSGLRPSALATAPGEVVVHMTGFSSDRGKAFVALWHGAEHFPGVPPKDAPTRVVSIVDGAAEARFTDVAAGSFAVTVFHDEDGDAQLKQNFLGIPKEGIGFSNNIKPRWRAPRYREAELTLQPGEQALVAIRMLYL